MKNNILLLCTAGLLSSATASFSQIEISSSSGKETIVLSSDTCIVLSTFKGTVNSDKVYLNWTVKNQHEDGIYVIYHSVDGINFENIGYKQGIGVPISNDIAYYFTDKLPSQETNYYKILFVAKNSTYFMSERISVTMDINLTAEISK